MKFERGDLSSAFEVAEQGSRKYESKDSNWAWRFRVLKAEILVWQGRSKESLTLLVEEPPASLSADELVVRRRVAQGYASCFVQDFAGSARYFNQAEQLAKSLHRPLLAEVLTGQGTLSLLRGDYKSATDFYTQALSLARTNKNEFVEANVLGNMGVSAMRRQRFDEAVDWFTDAIELAHRLSNRTQSEKTLGNLGWCYYQLGDFERALENFRSAESTTVELGLLKDQLTWLNNIGLIYDQQRDYGSATTYYQKALDIARRLENKSASAVALNNLAVTALERHDLDSATRYNDESARLQGEIGDKSALLYPLLNTGRIAAGNKQFSSAEAAFLKVIGGSSQEASLRWEAETDLAGLYAAEGKDALADAQYRKALETIDNARSSLSKEEHRLSFLTTATRFYNDYIDFLVSHGRPREALAVAEHSRARTLAEGLRVPVSQLSGAAFHPEQNVQKLDSVVLSYWLKPERSYLWVVTPNKVALFPLAGQDDIDAAVKDYRKALLGPRDVKDTGNAAGQKLYEMLVAPAQKLLPNAPPCPTSAAVSRRGHHEPLDSQIRTCGQSAPRIIVIADGSLLSLNFETLLVPSLQPHYWIEDATISNASSIALLGSRTSSPSRFAGRVGHDDGQKLLLIGDPTYTGTEFPKLTQAKLEVQKVESYFPAEGRVVINGDNAKPSSYASTKPVQFKFVHFVAHGTASRVSPLDSSIVLSREGDSYKLYARDIMTQPLKAELVTISACYGAGNRAYSGEGLVGLSWAFLRAGAHNVIAALWEVNDASTPQLMDNLYLNVRNGQDPATALRTAKLAMLHSGSVYRRPFYWGVFQLYVGS